MLALTAAEALALWLYHRLTGRGLRPRDYLLNLVSGLCLMAAIKAVLLGAAWHWTALCLMAAGCAHVSDLWMRMRAPRT